MADKQHVLLIKPRGSETASLQTAAVSSELQGLKVHLQDSISEPDTLAADVKSLCNRAQM